MSELDELKRLLFGDEQRSLSELEQRVENPTTRAQDVATVLADSIRLESERGSDLSGALRKPVNDCIRLSVQQDTEVFADALFPIMGPAIRKSVMETFKELIQRLNETVETAFSWQGVKWRVESLRTGVPVTELALRDTLEYRVEQVFLIHRDTGLLIRHAAREDLPGHDSDAVSAMLTAIRDFVRDSFGGDDRADLDAVDIGEHTVWLLNGPSAILAVVFRGIPPMSLRTRFRGLLEQLHRAHAQAFEAFAGDTDAFAMLDESLGEHLVLQSLTGRRKPAPGERSLNVSPALAWTLGIVVAAIALYVTMGMLAERKLAALVERLEVEPGIVVTAAYRDGEPTVEGLADPRARDADALAVEAGYDPGEVRWRLAPVLSMDPPLVAARARGLLRPPPGVTVAYDGRVLTVAGHAPDAWAASVRTAPLELLGIARVDTEGLLSLAALAARRLEAPESVTLSWADGVLYGHGRAGVDWLERAAEQAPAIDGIERFDATDVDIEPDSLVARWRHMLAPPEGVRLTLERNVLVVDGAAPRAWIEQVRRAVPAPVYIDGLDTSGLVAAEHLALENAARALDGRVFRFTENAELDPDSAVAVAPTAARITELLALAAEQAGVSVEFTAIGYTDPTGRPSTNARLRASRARTLADALNTQLGRPGVVDARAATLPENDARSTRERAAVLRVGIDAAE